jgi:hypothetical protein
VDVYIFVNRSHTGMKLLHKGIRRACDLPTSNDLVAFVIKLPGKVVNGKDVYLPIKVKLPQED